MKKKVLALIAVTVMCVAAVPARAQESTTADTSFEPAVDYLQAEAAIQVSSNVSDGSYSLEDIAAVAKAEGIDVVILADRDLMRWQYGLWPVRRVIKRTVEHNSIFKYGIKKYLRNVAAVQAANPDMVIIAGIESSPFYYWKEDPRHHRLAIKNWHKHLLVIGLDDPEAIRRLPVTGNVAGLALPCMFSCVGYFFFPLLAFAAGIYFLTNKRFGYTRFHQVLINVGNLWPRIFGIILILFGIALLAYGYPYRDMKFDQFGGDRGIMPYQNFIDYVNEKGGMAFWTHPEAENIQRTRFVDIITPEHSEALLQARDYQGFGVFQEGYERVGKPGGIWDHVLNEYCEGLRGTPVWAIGCMGVDKTTDLERSLSDLRTVFLVRELTKEAVIDALRQGRNYAARGKLAPLFRLDTFTARDISTQEAMTMGETLLATGAPVIEIKGHFTDGKPRPLRIRIIRNGMIIKVFTEKTPFTISYQDEYSSQRVKDYYRLEVEASGLLAVTNPVFVERE